MAPQVPLNAFRTEDAGSCECTRGTGMEPDSSLLLLLLNFRRLLVVGLAGGLAWRDSKAREDLPNRRQIWSRVVRTGCGPGRAALAFLQARRHGATSAPRRYNHGAKNPRRLRRAWPSPPAPGSVPMKSSARSAPAAWARSTEPATRVSIAPSRSRSSRLTVAGDADSRARFEREARAVAALDHPHICGIYDVGERDGTHFLVMPHLEGQTLAARLEKRAAPARPGVEDRDRDRRRARQGASPGHHPSRPQARQHHADEDGREAARLRPREAAAPAGPISLSGMTRRATATPGTAHGTILGTVQYMAPEQVEGREADARSDIWALGAVHLRDGDRGAAVRRRHTGQRHRRDPAGHAAGHLYATAAGAARARSSGRSLSGEGSG